MPRPSESDQPTPVLLVATWYPAVDDPGRGRFVADQAEALLNHGGVRPLVASFDIAYVLGSADAKRAGSVTAHLRTALASRSDVVSPGAWSVPAPIGVARLPTPEPYGKASLPPGVEADQRREALEMLADRLDPGNVRGVVHAHTAYPDGYAAIGIARRLGWPLLITEHASFVSRQLRQPEHRRRYLEAARSASRFIAVSDMLASELRAAIPELQDKLLVMPNVIPLAAFEPAGREERVPDELIFVGNRKETKGMVTLLRAFADVLEQRPGATLRLIGKSTTRAEEERWLQLAADLEIAHAVRFEAPMERAAVAAALRRASVFVHPSPRETFGVVTLEALASGLPVVAVQSGGISGILEDGRLGALVPPHDARMLARAVLRTLDRLDEFDPQVLHAAVAPFSGEAVAPRLAALYREVLSEPADVRHAAPVGAGTVGWSGRAQPVADSVILLAHDTDRAARVVGGMPPELLRRITLVTHGDTAGGRLPDGIGRVVLTRDDVTAELRRRGLYGARRGLRDRLLRLAANPIAPIQRRLAKGGLPEVRWQATAAGIARTLAQMPFDGAGEAAPEVFCLDSIDYAVAEPLVGAGRLRAAPGGPYWLADRWAATQMPGERSAATGAPRGSEVGSVSPVG